MSFYSPFYRRTLRPAATGGDAFRDWTTMSLDLADWKTSHGPGSTDKSAALTKDGDIIQWNCENSASSSIQISGGTVRGTFLIAKLHLKPWTECGLTRPSGVDEHEFYPDTFNLTIEVQTDTIPITGPTSDATENNYGRLCSLQAGIVHYTSDQSSDPAHPTTNYAMGRVHKFGSGNPDNDDDNTNLYKSGYVTGNGNGSVIGARWACQPTGGNARHDALVFQASFGAVGLNSSNHVIVQGGSYATTNPRVRTLQSGTAQTGSATAFSGASDQYVHIALGFGGFNTTGTLSGRIRVKRIRYLLQPINNREALQSA